MNWGLNLDSLVSEPVLLVILLYFFFRGDYEGRTDEKEFGIAGHKVCLIGHEKVISMVFKIV